jgi:glycosyltransferase involved in cell wall biosynthesis
MGSSAQYNQGPQFGGAIVRFVRRPSVLINSLSLGQGGGGRSYIVNVLRELDRDARDLHIAVLADPAQLPVDDTRGLEVLPVRLPDVSGGARLAVRVGYEQTVLPLRAARFDLLYCPADVSPAVARTPTVVALRNMHIYDRSYYDTVRLDILGWLVKAGLRRVRRVLFPTRAAADKISLTLQIPADRVAIVPHGVAAEAFDSTPAEASDRPPYLFLASSVERHKRTEVLVRSLQYVSDPRMEVWVAGDDAVDAAYTAEVRALADKLGVASRVRLLGQVPYREILGYYRGAVAFAFTSLLETFGHPMLEAMLAETPIVAADISSFREIAGDIALYFAPDDAEGLARAVDEVQRDPDAARERVARGRARAREFSWASSVDDLCRVLHEVLAEGAR